METFEDHTIMSTYFLTKVTSNTDNQIRLSVLYRLDDNGSVMTELRLPMLALSLQVEKHYALAYGKNAVVLWKYRTNANDSTTSYILDGLSNNKLAFESLL